VDTETELDKLSEIISGLTDKQRSTLEILYKQSNEDIKRGSWERQLGEYWFGDIRDDNFARLQALNDLEKKGLVVGFERVHGMLVYNLTGVGYVACTRMKL
jgi:hypothetical protein